MKRKLRNQNNNKVNTTKVDDYTLYDASFSAENKSVYVMIISFWGEDFHLLMKYAFYW